MLIGLAWVSSWTRCGLKHRSDRQWTVSGTDHQELIRCEEGLISGAMFRFGTLNIRNAHEFLCRHHLVIGLRTFSSTWKPSGSFSRLDYEENRKRDKNKVALLFSAEILDHFWIILVHSCGMTCRCQEHRRNMPFIGVWINLIPSNLGWLHGRMFQDTHNM